MASDFSGKKYLVTGVGSGIGRVLAIELANSGAEVWGCSRTKSNLDSLSVRIHLIIIIIIIIDFIFLSDRISIANIVHLHRESIFIC